MQFCATLIEKRYSLVIDSCFVGHMRSRRDACGYSHRDHFRGKGRAFYDIDTLTGLYEIFLTNLYRHTYGSDLNGIQVLISF